MNYRRFETFLAGLSQKPGVRWRGRLAKTQSQDWQRRNEQTISSATDWQGLLQDDLRRRKFSLPRRINGFHTNLKSTAKAQVMSESWTSRPKISALPRMSPSPASTLLSVTKAPLWSRTVTKWLRSTWGGKETKIEDPSHDCISQIAITVTIRHACKLVPTALNLSYRSNALRDDRTASRRLL